MIKRRGFLAFLAKALALIPVGMLRGRVAEQARAASVSLPAKPTISLDRLTAPWSVAEFEFTKLVETHRGPRPSTFPGYIVRLPDAIQRRLRSPHGLYAVSRICPHEGCPINFYSTRREVPDRFSNVLKIKKFPNPLFLCTCHQSLFDPAQGGKVMEGPSPRPPHKFDFTVADGKVIIESLEPGGDKWG